MKKSNTIGCLIYSVFGLIFLITFIVSIAGQFNTNAYNVTVTDKLVKHNNEDSKYLVFTELEDGKVKVFQDTDSLLRRKYNSSDVYAEIKIGHKYEFDVYGYRIPALSYYENIVHVKEIK